MDETDSFIQAADEYSRRLGARASGPADFRAARETGSAAGRGDQLPDGYLLYAEVKDLALLGRWPLLDDRMSACMPTRTLLAMQNRSALGDREAEAWLKLHSRACAGDPDAQREFGRACENGSHRAPADVQRAFFWYYRAGLQGDSEGRCSAERLMHRSPRICPATMAEPVPVYPGEWRITAHLSRDLRSTSIFSLAADGSARGTLLGNSRAAAEAAGEAPGHPSYSGGWAYDGIGRVLTIIFESEAGERRWRNAYWQIDLLGCRPGSIFGRDRRRVGYTLEPVAHSEL